MRIILLIFFHSFILSIFCFGQFDDTKYPWPTPNFNSSRGLNATFGEFRNTLTSDHFHNGVDIGEPDGNPVYPSIDGTVSNFVNAGYDSYINVKSIINGKKKHLTYYHVVPNPSLYINQNVVKGETIIGTIYNGAAHVHLIERELMDISTSSLGTEINPVRPEGGLEPYEDPYAPTINEASIKFFEDNSIKEIPSNQLTGNIDIRIDVRERNGTSSSQINNGTYILGYRIFSEDGNTKIYEPENEGIKYRFYYLPNNGYVHNVFVKGLATLSDPIYWLTNGNGEKYINENLVINNNYLNTDLFDEGNYQLEIFTEDTRGNKSSKRFPISIAKLPPELNTVILKDDKIKISWSPYILNNLKGFRIYYSDDRTLENWKLAANESFLTSESDSIIFNSPTEFLIPSNKTEFYFYITAVDSFENESISSDTYSLSIASTNSPKFLIVDGFDRYGGNGSWSLPQHNFNTYYFDALFNTVNYNISSCSNDAIINNEIDLNIFDLVCWFVGDESFQENTFIFDEQYRLAQFLENGGKLFVSGEDIGQDLDTQHSKSGDTDTLFYHHYLKAKLMHEGLDLLFEVYGEEQTQFESVHAVFGETYPCESPDDIEPINGGEPILNYTYERDGTFRKGGIAYTGTFGESNLEGQVVYLSFPFETIGDENSRNQLMTSVLWYFGIILIDVDESPLLNNTKFELCQNYPNPFNPTTTIRYSIPNNTVNSNPQRGERSPISEISPSSRNDNTNVKLVVYDVLGKEIATLVNQKQAPGTYTIMFDATNLSSGIYYYQLKTETLIQTKKMVLIK